MNEQRQQSRTRHGNLRRYARVGVGTALSIVATTAYTQNAHVHGLAALNIVIEENVLAVELTSPLANLSGFEHAPATAAEQKELTRVQAMLLQADSLFKLPAAAECTAIASATIDGPGFLTSSDMVAADGHHDPDHKQTMADATNDHDDDHDAGNHDDDHDRDHDDEHHSGNHDDDHDEDHDDDHHAGNHDGDHDGDHAEHADVRVSYRFRCDSPAKLSALTLVVFETFPSIETLDVTALGATGVVHDERGPDQPVVDLSAL